MSREQHGKFQILAFILAIQLPGLGHCYLGHVRRGLMVLAGVMGLFLGGMLIGGIDAVDRSEDKWWFVLQAGVGPTAFVVDSIHQNVFKVDAREGGRTVRRSALPDPTMNPGGASARSTKSLGRVNEVGSLYVAMAGMLNMIAVLDAAWRLPRRKDERRTP